MIQSPRWDGKRGLNGPYAGASRLDGQFNLCFEERTFPIVQQSVRVEGHGSVRIHRGRCDVAHHDLRSVWFEVRAAGHYIVTFSRYRAVLSDHDVEAKARAIDVVWV